MANDPENDSDLQGSSCSESITENLSVRPFESQLIKGKTGSLNFLAMQKEGKGVVLKL